MGQSNLDESIFYTVNMYCVYINLKQDIYAFVAPTWILCHIVDTQMVYGHCVCVGVVKDFWGPGLNKDTDHTCIPVCCGLFGVH